MKAKFAQRFCTVLVSENLDFIFGLMVHIIISIFLNLFIYLFMWSNFEATFTETLTGMNYNSIVHLPCESCCEKRFRTWKHSQTL